MSKSAIPSIEAHPEYAAACERLAEVEQRLKVANEHLHACRVAFVGKRDEARESDDIDRVIAGADPLGPDPAKSAREQLQEARRRVDMLELAVRRHRERLDLVLCPGEAAAATLRRAGLRTPVTVLPNPFDADAVRATARAAGGPTPRWPADDARPGSATGAPPIRLVFVGRVEREKGLAIALEAWPVHGSEADAELLVVGGGGDLDRCRRIAAERGLTGHVRFAGPRPRAEALAAIAAADAMLLPSRTPEVAPMVLLEALALGTRVIAPAFGAMQEILAVTGEAHAIDPMDPAALPAQLAAAITACGRRGDAAAAGAATDAAAAAAPAVEAFLAARRPERHVASLEAVYAGHTPGE